ncbi:recombinase RecT [Microbispora sp. NPDC049125]|uniref:recombinase RecT n=1 Tax=Microbispora sp. NPDC049125 TaxID=3154929 RepID=UPI00346566AB
MTQTETAPLPPKIQEAMAEAEAAQYTGDLVLHRPGGGTLTIRPDQIELDPDQWAAIESINLDPKDERLLPHLRRAIHVGQLRGLDIWTGEFYLVVRGEGQYRTYTCQTGIDGYRKLAAKTKRQIGAAKWLWTGNDDDDRCWRETRDPDTGELVMERVWYTQWPVSRGYPGAARAIIKHYDQSGNIVVSDAIASWAMYAPWIYETEWRDGKNGRSYKARLQNPDGSPKMKLPDMWQKGADHMLAKSAEALCIRKAFPEAVTGLFTDEEMAAAHADLERRIAEAAAVEAAASRREAFEAHARSRPEAVRLTRPKEPAAVEAQAAPAPPAPGPELTEAERPEVPVEPEPERPDVPEAPEVPAEPEPTIVEPPAAPESPAESFMTPEEQWGHLVREIDKMGEVMGASLKTFIEAEKKRPLTEIPADELITIVGPLRERVVRKMIENGWADRAQVYSQFGARVIAPWEVLTGIVVPE